MNLQGTISAKIISVPVRILTFVCFAFAVCFSSSANAESVVKRLDAKHELYKLVGQLSNSHDLDNYGQGLFVGNDGCHVLTNFHVAFADGADANGDLKVQANPATGQVVTFSFNPDEAGKFQNIVKGKVIEFANYIRGIPRGRLGDLALVRLDTCQGKAFAGLAWDPIALEKGIPAGKLSALSAVRTSNGKNIIALEEGCEAFKQTLVTGIILSTCHSEAGMSSNLLMVQGEDNVYRLAGIGSGHGPLPDGKEVAIGISSKVIAKFLSGALGDIPTAMAPLVDDRKPQSTEQTAMIRPQAVVR